MRPSSSTCIQVLHFAMEPLATKPHTPRYWAAVPHPRAPSSRSCRPQRPRAWSVPFLSDMAVADLSKSLEALLGSVLAYTPQTLQPVLLQLGQKASSLVTMPLQPDTTLKLLFLAYFFLSKPSPFSGIIDFYVTGPLGYALRKRWKSDEFQLRERMGGGNFGTTYEAIVRNANESTVGSNLTSEQKKRRVVMKRVNLDREGIRSNFLRQGTMARGAAETGKVEAYMYSKIGRNPFIRRSCAEFKGSFTAEQSAGGITAGTQWLIWSYESDSTLEDAIEGRLGTFPQSLADLFVPNFERYDEEEIERKVIKVVVKKILQGLKNLHDVGIVHRDVKPANLLVTVEGDVKFIDFGAAADLSTGINFNPDEGMLDPRYSPPEDLVLPRSFPKPPPPFIAVFFSPLLWIAGRPDLFDSYSIGMILMQMSVPQLRGISAQKIFSEELSSYFYDLNSWRMRSTKGKTCDFSILDDNNGAGWDLACKLIGPRNSILRGRLSAAAALKHRFLREVNGRNFVDNMHSSKDEYQDNGLLQPLA